MNHHCIGRFVDGQWKGKWRSELGDEYHRLPGQVRDWTGWSLAGQNTKFLLTHQFSCHTLGGDKLSILPDSKIKSWHSEKLCFVSFCIKETKFGAKLTKVHNICFSDSSFPSNPLHLIPRHRQASMSGWGGACAQMCTGSSQEAGICVMGPRFKWQETNPWHEAVTASCWVELHLHRWPSLGWDKIFSEKFLLKFHGSRSRRSGHS